MAIKNWSKKRKTAVVLLAVFAVGIAGTLAYFIWKPEAALEVDHATVTRGEITQTLDATGTVESSGSGSFEILSGTKVVSVNVRVGDRVKQGDVLATFDTSSLNSLVSEKQSAYNSANKTYLDAKKTASTSASEIAAKNKRIAEIDAQLAKESNTAKQEEETTSSLPANLQSILSNLLSGDFSDLTKLSSGLSSLLSGGSSFGYDMSSLMGSSTTLELEKMQLQTELAMLELQSSEVVVSAYQTVMESAKASLQETKAAVATLNNGWVAKKDGVIREINITEGETFVDAKQSTGELDVSAILNLASGDTSDIGSIISQLMGSKTYGMVVEYYPFIANFTLNKYDVLKVSMDQRAYVTSPSGTVFEGSVVYISAVASESSDLNISSLLGSGSSSGVLAKVEIPQPDESIIIGLDISISVELDTQENVLLVPTEAVQFSDKGQYVYVYDPNTKKVEQRSVEVGLISSTKKQILSGVEEGEIVLKSQTDLDVDTVRIKLKDSVE